MTVAEKDNDPVKKPEETAPQKLKMRFKALEKPYILSMESTMFKIKEVLFFSIAKLT